MNTKEKFAYLVTPILIGFCLIITGIILTMMQPKLLQGVIIICTGLISIILSVMMSLLIRLLDK